MIYFQTMLALIIALLVQFCLLGVLLLLLIYFISLVISDFFGVPFVPTTHSSVDKIFDAVKLKKKDVFIDLGCGDGRTVFYVAKKYGCKAIGIEMNPLLNWYARIQKKIFKTNKVEFRRANIYKTVLSEVSVIYMFLFPETIEKLKPKFLKECSPGTRIISHGFKVKNFEKHLTEYRESKPFSTYYYTI